MVRMSYLDVSRKVRQCSGCQGLHRCNEFGKLGQGAACCALTGNMKHDITQSAIIIPWWTKVFRMTQIFIFIKSAASVSLDIFVRCYYGILKYNYKHFTSVKGFY